jgi:thioredoxin-related protein
MNIELQFSKVFLFKFIVSLFLIGILNVTQTKAQQELYWYSFEEAIVIAESTNRPIFVDVWAPWCGWCRKMKLDVYPALYGHFTEDFVLTRLNRDDNETSRLYKDRRITSMQLAKLLKTKTIPAIVILNSKGEYLLDLSGFMEIDQLDPILKYISSKSYLNQTFEDFKGNIISQGNYRPQGE